MPMEIDWYIPYRVIDARLIGSITVQDIREMALILVDLLAQGEEQAPGTTLYLLYDTSAADSMPPIYLMMKEALPVLRFKNRGPMFHITRNKTIRSIIELSAHVTRFQLYTFATRDEALKVLSTVMQQDELKSSHS